jgi:hypothetical protein
MQKHGIKVLTLVLFIVIAFAIMIPGIGAAVTPGTSSTITWMNVCGRNNTGQTANDLELYIKGNVNVVDYWNKDKFNDITTSYDPTTNTTTVRFYNGTVFDGEEIHACIKIDGPDIEEQVRTWTLDGKVIGPVGPTLSTNFGKGEQGLVNINLGNLAKDGGPLVVAEFQYGPGKRVYQLSELLWSNPVLNAEIPWSPSQHFYLNVGENLVIPNIPMPIGTEVVVYRAKVFFEKEPEHVFEYVGQYEPIPAPTSITGINVCGRNNSGQTANDLELYIKGHIHVVDYWNKHRFNNVYTSYDPITNTTTVRFYNGTVFDGEEIHACIKIDGPDTEEQVRTWTLNGKVIGPVGPCLSTQFGAPKPGLADIALGNYAKNGDPMTVASFQYGPGKRVYKLEELLWSNPVLNAEIPWSRAQNLHLNVGEVKTIPYLAMPYPAVVMVYRAKVFYDRDPNKVFEYVGQFEPISTTAVAQ